jgi:hypothetical protein
MRVMVHLSTDYLLVKGKKNNRFYIQRKNPSLPVTFHSKTNIRISVNLSCFF